MQGRKETDGKVQKKIPCVVPLIRSRKGKDVHRRRRGSCQIAETPPLKSGKTRPELQGDYSEHCVATKGGYRNLPKSGGRKILVESAGRRRSRKGGSARGRRSGWFNCPHELRTGVRERTKSRSNCKASCGRVAGEETGLPRGGEERGKGRLLGDVCRRGRKTQAEIRKQKTSNTRF